MMRDNYIQEVLRDQPAGFWPLQELPGMPGAFARDYRPTNAPNRGLYNGAYELGQVGPAQGTCAWLGNGSSTSIACGSSLSLQPPCVTLECWVQLNSLAGIQMAMINRVGNWEVNGIYIFLYNGLWQFWGTTDQQNWTMLPGPPATTAWTHLAATADGSALRGYVNGQCVAATPFGTPLWDPAGSLTLGADVDGSSALSGRMAFVAVYASALPPGRIAGHYRAMIRRCAGRRLGFSQLNSALVDYYRRKRAA